VLSHHTTLQKLNIEDGARSLREVHAIVKDYSRAHRGSKGDDTGKPSACSRKSYRRCLRSGVLQRAPSSSCRHLSAWSQGLALDRGQSASIQDRRRLVDRQCLRRTLRWTDRMSSHPAQGSSGQRASLSSAFRGMRTSWMADS